MELKDSGSRQAFDTGAVRDIQEGKGRFDLLPIEAITRLAQHFEAGSKKYGDRNWEKGIQVSRYMDSMLRHAFKAAAGHDDEDHLAAVAWNALCAIATIERRPELDDRPKPPTGEEITTLFGDGRPVDRVVNDKRVDEIVIGPFGWEEADRLQMSGVWDIERKPDGGDWEPHGGLRPKFPPHCYEYRARLNANGILNLGERAR